MLESVPLFMKKTVRSGSRLFSPARMVQTAGNDNMYHEDHQTILIRRMLASQPNTFPHRESNPGLTGESRVS